MDISDLLDEYGPAIKENVSDFAWKMVTDEETGAITGIPREGTYFPKEDRTGAVTDGIAFRDDMLEKLDAEIPVTLDDFYQLLKNIKSRPEMQDLQWQEADGTRILCLPLEWAKRNGM